jgi:hypothetical protein
MVRAHVGARHEPDRRAREQRRRAVAAAQQDVRDELLRIEGPQHAVERHERGPRRVHRHPARPAAQRLAQQAAGVEQPVGHVEVELDLSHEPVACGDPFSPSPAGGWPGWGQRVGMTSA